MKQLCATLFLLGASVSTGILCVIVCLPAHADGLDPSQRTRSPSADINAAFPAINLRINQPSGLAGLNAAGQITAPIAGDAGDAQVTAAAPGGTMAVPLRLRNSDRISVRDYAPGGVVGGAYNATALVAQAIGDNVVQMMPNSYLQVHRSISATGLPAGTIITGVGAQTGVTVRALTCDKTIPEAQQSLLFNQHGMATALVFASAQIVPVGAIVGGAGIAAGSTVVALSTDSRTVYISQAVTHAVPAGTPITFSYASVLVYLSNSWTNAPAAGTAIGIYTQDDYAAFSNAAFWNDPGVGGEGARIYVPSGQYYLSKPVFTRSSTSFELGPNVSFISSSASIDAMDGTFPTYSHTSLIGTGQGANSVPTELNIAQTIYQRTVPDREGQAILVAQTDDCNNDGSGWGCGIVGEEVKQLANPTVRRGAFWEYHGTDYILPGQSMSWAGAELEVANSSGFWGAWAGNALNGNHIGLHIDNIMPTDPTHVSNSYALDPAGDWHTMAMCDNSILDWCIAHSDGHFSNQQPMLDSGIDSKGRLFGSAFIAMQTAPDTGANIGVVTATRRTAAMNNDGTMGALAVNTPTLTNSTAGVASIAIEDGGRFNGPIKLVIGAPPRGGTQATAHVGSYLLRAVQGAAAINADFMNGSNAPAGIAAGTVFALPGGSCISQPQVIYDGEEFVVSKPGLCTVLPADGTHTPPVGMIRYQLQLTYVSGGGGTPATLPLIEPLYGIASVQIDTPGSGYNAAVPPDVFGETSFDSSAKVWTGIIYTPMHLASVLGEPSVAPVNLGASMTLSALPPKCAAGDISFVSDARNMGELPGAGTGALAYCTKSGRWFANGAPIRK